MPSAPLFLVSTPLQQAMPNIHPTRTCRSSPRPWRAWTGVQRVKILFGLHLFPCLRKKSKIFCFGGCLRLPGKPWLVGRTFPGTDFTADLMAVAISQLGLSSYAFPPAVPWPGCSKEPLLPLHSCACTHLRIRLVRRHRQERRKCLQFSCSRPSAHLQPNTL